MRFVIKTLISALIIAGVSEIGKRSTVFAAILASLPLASILALIWLFHDTGDAEKIAKLSHDILWAILPSVVFFIALPFLLKQGWRFSTAMIISCIVMSASYWIYFWGLQRVGL